MLAETRDPMYRANAHGAAVGRLLAAFVLFFVISGTSTRADILDKFGNIIPGTEGITAGPGLYLPGYDLTNASFNFNNLTSAEFNTATLTGAVFSGANLIGADLSAATFNDATLSNPTDFTDAQIASANFSFTTPQGFTRAMFESTKSFQVKDLIGVNFQFNDMSGWNFAGQNLAATSAPNIVTGGLGLGSFNTYDMVNGTFNLTDFTQANLAGTSAAQSLFGNPTLTVSSFYQANLASVDFSISDLTNATMNFANLNYATLTGAVLTGVDMTDATVASANFTATTSGTLGLGFVKAQLYSTKSYKDLDIRGINLSSNNLAGWDFTNQNATSASFSSATLSNGTFGAATFNGANLSYANFSNATLSTNGTTNFTDFNNATVNFANFSGAKGFVFSQLQSTASYQNFDLSGINLSSNNLTVSGTTNMGWTFVNQNLSSVNFSNATLTSTVGLSTFQVSLSGATITFANFSNTTSRGFTPALLAQTASYNNKSLQGVNFSSNNLSSTVAGTWTFDNQDLTGASFTFSNLSTTSFQGATLTLANFNSATLTGAYFGNATITGANFTSTTSRGFTPALLAQTASYTNQDLQGINLSSDNLSSTTAGTWNFSSQDLSGASFSSSNVSTTTFSGATLSLASLNNATLTGATFTSATMTGANLSNAKLFYTDFTGADLSGANFTGTTFSSGTSALDGATFTHATIKGATLSLATSHGFSDQMLYATDSYQVAQDLTGTNFSGNDMTGWYFGDDTHKLDLSSVSFAFGTLTNAQFSNTTVAFANFTATTNLGFTFDQLTHTASYVADDLHGINLSSNDLRNWLFTDVNVTTATFNLSTANFSNSVLSSGGTADLADFSRAVIAGANFTNVTAGGFTEGQLDETQSYMDGDLNHVNFSFNNLAPVNPVTLAPLAAWDLHDQNLQGATFDSSVLSNYDTSGPTPVLANSVDFTGSNIKDASFNSTTDKGFTSAQLYSTQSYTDHSLGAIGFAFDDLSGWDLSGQSMHGANFSNATLDSTNFTGARIGGANFMHTTPFGFTSGQLYSTDTYGSLVLGSINLSQNNLAGWNFASQSMAQSNFSESLLTSATFNDSLLQDANFFRAGLILTSFDRADLRGAIGFTGATLSTANTILPDGTIQGLDLTPDNVPAPQDRHLVIRDYNGATSIPIHITKGVSLDSTSTLAIRLHDGSWGSTISFDPGIPLTLAGTLDLGLDDQALNDPALLTDLYNYTGHERPIQLFKWNSMPDTQFDTVAADSRFSWDLSDLYMGGTVLINGLYGDVDRNGRVDVGDLLIMAQHWQQSAPDWTDGDMNGDGIVNIIDLRLLAANWDFGVYDSSPTASSPPPLSALLTSLNLPMVSVPEPLACGPLMMLAAIALVRRKRRGNNQSEILSPAPKGI